MMFHGRHSLKIVLEHGPIMGAGIDHGGVEPLVAEEALDRGDLEA